MNFYFVYTGSDNNLKSEFHKGEGQMHICHLWHHSVLRNVIANSFLYARGNVFIAC